MGSFIEINDTLQITKEQGFPKELDLETHLKTPYKSDDFKGQVFNFANKPKVRIYKLPPVRNFLVENREGKWVYWGLAHILEVTHDNVSQTTSGKFKIIHINSPEQMKQAHDLIDRNLSTQYFKD